MVEASKDVVFRSISRRKPLEGLRIEVTRSYFTFRNVVFCERGSRSKTSQEAPAEVQARTVTYVMDPGCISGAELDPQGLLIDQTWV